MAVPAILFECGEERVNSLPASGDFSCLLNSLDLDQDRQSVSPDLDLYLLTLR